mgnify:CR=1 FL=1
MHRGYVKEVLELSLGAFLKNGYRVEEPDAKARGG